jgi:hypothetical protein
MDTDEKEASAKIIETERLSVDINYYGTFSEASVDESKN